MQPSGFFGSMGMPGGMPMGASSFMAPGAVTPGSPNSLTSPPMGDKLMQALKQLSMIGQGMDASQGGAAALPPNSFSPFMDGGGQPPQAGATPPAGGGMPGAMPGAGAPGAGASPLGGLNPDMLKQLLMRLGIGPKPAGV